MPQNLDSDPIPNDPSRPRPVVHSFGLGADRFPIEMNQHLTEEPLILDVKYPADRPVKNSVNIGKQEPRFVDKL
jgi:hypothetical protein